MVSTFIITTDELFSYLTQGLAETGKEYTYEAPPSHIEDGALIKLRSHFEKNGFIFSTKDVKENLIAITVAKK